MFFLRLFGLRDYRLPFSQSDAGKHLSASWSSHGVVSLGGQTVKADPFGDYQGLGLEAGVPTFSISSVAKVRPLDLGFYFDDGDVNRIRRRFKEKGRHGRWATRRVARNIIRGLPLTVSMGALEGEHYQRAFLRTSL